MKHIERLSVKYHNKSVGTLSLTPDNRLCTFEYDSRWLATGFSISPLELPLKSGLFIAKAEPFNGNFGIFEDSLPDGYGRYLLHKALLREGINSFNLSAIDRLSIVGESGMGALTYTPITPINATLQSDDFDSLQAKALEVLGEKQDTDAELLLFNSGNSGGARPKAVFSDSDGHWLVKFRHTYDPIDMGLQEYRYNEIARECGIRVPDFKLVNGKYFASRRFDLTNDGERIHLLALTAYLTHDINDIEEMFRRMTFNYLSDNKDDHCKNFSFLITQNDFGKWQWHLAPAYDLTLCTEGYNGQHATSVNGTPHPTVADFIALGKKVNIPESRCRSIIDHIRSRCTPILRYNIQ